MLKPGDIKRRVVRFPVLLVLSLEAFARGGGGGA